MPHEPERDSGASDSESSESDSYDDADYAAAFDSDRSPNEDEWEYEGSVESGVIESAAEVEHAEEIGKPQPEHVMAKEPARVVAAQAAPAMAVQPQRVVIDNAEETESQMEEHVDRKFAAGCAEQIR